MPISAITLFCDDIRYERDGKRTLVGVHQDARLAESYPLEITQLFAMTFVRCPRAELPDQLAVTLTQNGQDDEVLEFPQDFLEQSRQRVTDQTGPEDQVTFEAVARLSDMKITEETRLAVRVTTPRGDIPAGRLILRAHTDGSPETGQSSR